MCFINYNIHSERVTVLAAAAPPYVHKPHLLLYLQLKALVASLSRSVKVL